MIFLNNSVQIFFVSASAILGLIIGSFLNVVILRINTGKGLGGRSQCFSCNRQLRWYELIPVVSYLVQRGRCTQCRSRISVQYMLVELITALLFVGVALQLSVLEQPVTFILWLILISAGMVIAVYDIYHQVIPEWPLVVFMAASIALGMHGLGFLLVPLPFFILWALSKGRLMGFGDVEIMAAMGALLGVVAGAEAVIIAFWIACIVILPWYGVQKLRKKHVSNKIAFGPFLLVATYLVGIVGVSIFDLMITMVK